jgi:hypothetical protein
MGDKFSGDHTKRHYPPKITHADPTKLYQIYQKLPVVQLNTRPWHHARTT